MKFLGDTHGKRKYLRSKHFQENMIQLGDCHLFGYKFAHYDAPRYFIDGNHDNFKVINPNATKPYEVYGNLWYIPRGYAKDNMLFIGGGDSIDKSVRTEGYDWFREEVTTYAQIMRALSHPQKIEIVISHECPLIALESMFSNVMNTSVANDLNAILEYYNPALWIFGHHHKSYDFTLRDCRFKGLAEGEILEI